MRRAVITGLLAGLLGLIWTSVSQGLIPIRHDLGYKEAPGESAVLEALDGNLAETGLYLVPNDAPPDSLFRARYEEGPIYRIHSLRAGAGGVPHVVVPVLALLLAPIIPAVLLGYLCRQCELEYLSRVAVVAVFGVFLALWAELRLWGMELYPLSYSIFLAVNSVVTWVLLGAFMAWRIRPQSPSPE